MTELYTDSRQSNHYVILGQAIQRLSNIVMCLPQYTSYTVEHRNDIAMLLIEYRAIRKELKTCKRDYRDVHWLWMREIKKNTMSIQPKVTVATGYNPLCADY